jgi:hypothetical protein
MISRPVHQTDNDADTIAWTERRNNHDAAGCEAAACKRDRPELTGP